jgi:hypothetical protein
VVLAGGPLWAWPATLLVRSRLAGALAGRLALVGAVGGPLLGVDPGDGRAGSLVVGPLAWVTGPGAERSVRVSELVGVSVLFDLGRGVAPGPPTPGRLGHRPQRLQDIAGPVDLDGEPGGPSLPGQGPHDLPILRAEVGVGFQPALAALLMLAQLPLPIVGPVGLLCGHRQPTRHPSGLVLVTAKPAKHARGLTAAGLLVSGQGFLGLLAVAGGADKLAAAVAGGLVELVAESVPLGPQLRCG